MNIIEQVGCHAEVLQRGMVWPCRVVALMHAHKGPARYYAGVPVFLALERICV